MILCIAQILNSEELRQLRAYLDAIEYVDGRTTAGWHARQVKRNLQVDRRAEGLEAMQTLVIRALNRHPLFQIAARPKAIRPPLFSCYREGMEYGSHVDDAVMEPGGPGALRSDVSLTLFLNDPEEYGGGELVMEPASGEDSFKLQAGDALVYPSSSLHRVTPVSHGMRLAAVTWVQSLVRDPARRELLFDLDTARRMLYEQQGKTREFDLLSKSLANLMRMWAEL